MNDDNLTPIERADAAVHDLVHNAESSTLAASRAALKQTERLIEKLLFAGRWLLAPLYVGLVLSLIPLVFKFGASFFKMYRSMGTDTLHGVTLEVLELLDITLLGNLIVIVIFSGYENFVSKIRVSEKSEDRPAWMGKVDYSGLKIKLIGSLVAISVIELLKDFMTASTLDPAVEKWRVGIHFTFVLSGVLFALMDFIADKRVAFEISVEKQLLDMEEARAESKKRRQS
ncbi:MAG: TIGR00645 family protein [Actinomycetes bacterium]